MDVRKVTEKFAVSPQIAPQDFDALKDQGFRYVINNRPDGEDASQMSSAEAESAARKAGLTYIYAPFQGAPTPEAVREVEAALSQSPGPVLAYCRSGTRSITAWAIMTAKTRQEPPEKVIEIAAEAGYDLRALKDLLRNLASG
ncbi:MAG: TIGR01244 family sulfur transferase [Hyphomonadaceae bacterium]